MKWTGAVVGSVLTLALYQSSPIEAFAPVVPTVPTTARPLLWLSMTTNTSPLWRIQSTTTTVTAATATAAINGATPPTSNMGKLQTTLTKYGMMAFILAMCVALPLTLYPQRLLRTLKLINRVQSEKMALWTGQWCARWLLRLVPFCHIDCIPYVDPNPPQPAVWVCNHTSMLDVFVLLATDLKLRGKKKRPIKIVYWKQLEDNPVTKLLFRQCGFIPVQMADNGSGTANDYDRASFKTLLKDTKQAFDDGFDIALLPEGQLNPQPELGLLPVFSGAYTLAKMSKRSIHMMALHGVHQLWHPLYGMEPTSRNIKVKVYPGGRSYTSSKEFCDTFSHVVGAFGSRGEDVADLDQWLDGSAFKHQHHHPNDNTMETTTPTTNRA